MGVNDSPGVFLSALVLQSGILWFSAPHLQDFHSCGRNYQKVLYWQLNAMGQNWHMSILLTVHSPEFILCSIYMGQAKKINSSVCLKWRKRVWMSIQSLSCRKGNALGEKAEQSGRSVLCFWGLQFKKGDGFRPHSEVGIWAKIQTKWKSALVNMLEKGVLEIENSQYKGPEDKTYLIYQRKNKKTCVATA